MGGGPLGGFSACSPFNSSLLIAFERSSPSDDWQLDLSLSRQITNTPTGDDVRYNFDSGGLATSSAIPVPAAVWLFASGLGLLGWMRRK